MFVIGVLEPVGALGFPDVIWRVVPNAHDSIAKKVFSLFELVDLITFDSILLHCLLARQCCHDSFARQNDAS